MKKNTSNFAMILREFKQDKGATFFLLLLLAMILFIYIDALFLNTKQVMHVDILNNYLRPGKDGHLLGTDQGGRDVFHYLILGTRNSLNIGFIVTLLVEVLGIMFGLAAGYYGGAVDDALFRFYDAVADADASYCNSFDHSTLYDGRFCVGRFSFLMGRDCAPDPLQNAFRGTKRICLCG